MVSSPVALRLFLLLLPVVLLPLLLLVAVVVAAAVVFLQDTVFHIPQADLFLSLVHLTMPESVVEVQLSVALVAVRFVQNQQYP